MWARGKLKMLESNTSRIGRIREALVIISFDCRDCHADFASEVGPVTFTPDPVFSIPPSCPECGPRTNDQVWLTDEGQSQLTDVYLNG
jgi:DNA replicative helicase MCM subunit Mcm2 (Cdc46/Mcm family)